MGKRHSGVLKNKVKRMSAMSDIRFFRIIKVLEGLPNLLRGFREGFTIKTSIVVEGSS